MPIFPSKYTPKTKKDDPNPARAFQGRQSYSSIWSTITTLGTTTYSSQTRNQSLVLHLSSVSLAQAPFKCLVGAVKHHPRLFFSSVIHPHCTLHRLALVQDLHSLVYVSSTCYNDPFQEGLTWRYFPTFTLSM